MPCRSVQAPGRDMSPARQQVRPTCAPHCAAKRPAPRRHPSVRPAWRERLPSRAGRGWISQAAQARRGQARRSMVPRAWSHETLSRLKAMSLWSMSASSVRACRLNSSHSSIPLSWFSLRETTQESIVSGVTSFSFSPGGERAEEGTADRTDG